MSAAGAYIAWGILLGPLHGLTLETRIMWLPAVSYLVFAENQSMRAFGHAGAQPTRMLRLAGVVTALSPLMFGSQTSPRYPELMW